MALFDDAEGALVDCDQLFEVIDPEFSASESIRREVQVARDSNQAEPSMAASLQEDIWRAAFLSADSLDTLFEPQDIHTERILPHIERQHWQLRAMSTPPPSSLHSQQLQEQIDCIRLVGLARDYQSVCCLRGCRSAVLSLDEFSPDLVFASSIDFFNSSSMFLTQSIDVSSAVNRPFEYQTIAIRALKSPMKYSQPM
ncbi:hypothetical protein [Bradyrhizobium zhanjiangense]|uniref:Uncharacterized protein n=1 Tax=Bradyrhizobium zhanjiangense TaxID=1325107 RepID=A0A4Q0Q754_9BRAD|nr:hypothetical protein [Bradyrhizobium zhanjiangense]RXG85081.1 hypothetical protein EAS61_37005 [Bradyrhizobium zhanjiangense]RXG85393.1 hypothetical protein EAS62_38875 [Bradyrhizobium zhanjiangense]